ncbi:hypothetical protein BH23CHL10_BH23CHL10_13590 [soil metagenome]
MTFNDREYTYVASILAGLTELGHELPPELGKALEAWQRLGDELSAARVEASDIHPSAVAARYAADALAAAQHGKPLPDYGAELAAAEAALRWRNVKVDALAEAQGMAAASVAGAVGRSSEAIYGILRKSLADIMAQVRKLAPLVRDLPLTNPDLILRIADRAKIEAYQRLAVEADRLKVLRDVQFHLRRSSGGGTEGADYDAYTRPIARHSRPENRLEALLWTVMTPGVEPVVRTPTEAVAAEKEAHDARRRGQEAAA